MKIKLLAVLLVTIVAGTLAITTASSNTSKNLAVAKVPTIMPLPQDPTGTTDGAAQPDKIPDRVAYSLLFRFLSGRNTEDEKNRARAYVRMIFGCKDCGKQKETAESSTLSTLRIGITGIRDPSSDGCNQDPYGPMQPCYIAKASYNSATPQFGYFLIFTRFFLTISIRFTAYQLSSISPSRCIYSIDCPCCWRQCKCERVSSYDGFDVGSGKRLYRDRTSTTCCHC